MPQQSPDSPIRLTPYPTQRGQSISIERCPHCQNNKITKTPRRKSGPTVFHCRRCGFMTSVDVVFDTYRMLGHVIA